MMPFAHRLVGLALAVPPALVILCTFAVAAGERTGVRVFGAVGPANLAEAAATGRADDVVRRMRAGEDPSRVYDLHPDAISSIVLRATPLEAAVWSRQLLMIQLLDRAGAIQDAAHRRAIACLAMDLEMGDIVEYLSPGGTPECVPREAYDRVLARTPREAPND
jgi:hypothetical protein